MKRFLLALGLIVAMSAFVPTNAKVNVNVNIGVQPAWGPVGYDYAGYYYFPDIDIYYNVNASQFVYWDGRVWVSNRYLPYRYRNYDLYPMYKVVINDRDPWRYHDRHRRNYAHYRGNHNQVIIVNSRDHRYHNSRNNRVTWVDSNRRPSNNGHYSSNNHHNGNSSGRYSNQGRRPDSHYTNDNGRHNSHSNHNDRYASRRNTTSPRIDNRDNSASRATHNRDSQHATSRGSSSRDDRRSSNTSPRVNSNASSRHDRSLASVDRSSRSSRSDKTDSRSASRERVNR